MARVEGTRRSDRGRGPSRTGIARSAALAVAAVLALASAASGLAGTATTERVSVSSAGDQGNSYSNRYGDQPAISADGRYVAFSSEASNLVARDTNRQEDVFVRDRKLHTTERVSVSAAGHQGNSSSSEPAISADGRYVAFYSWASNLVPGDTNGLLDVFVRDRKLHTTERVSVSATGHQGNGDSSVGAISADGRYVAFWSSAANLVPGDTNGAGDVFVRDRKLHTTRRVSVSAAGRQGNGESGGAAISADGRYVAFVSYTSNLVPGDTNGRGDVFVRDRKRHTTRRVSVSAAGHQGNRSSYGAAISADGRYVAFTSKASKLVARDTDYDWDVFVRDRKRHTTELVSVSAAGRQGNGESGGAAISADGRYVAFDSYASNLVPGDTNGAADVFVRGPLP